MIARGGIIQDRHASLPLFLLGHSMSSFLTQKPMYAGTERYKEFILTETNGPRVLLSFNQNLANLQAKLQGPDHPSKLMNASSFGRFNKSFTAMRTQFDWLSRDEGEVDDFIENPLCCFVLRAGVFRRVIWPSARNSPSDRMAKIQKINRFMFSGASRTP
ncbi:serine aminopeptidase domain-containing protein [Fontibacillus phaseoli]|nr:alpha/beta hydrolase [Fontibacillus phaseoli]